LVFGGILEADLIVVGAGPAGSMAGLRAAELGLKTIIIDKENFPREKPCGGGLSANTIDFCIENNLMDIFKGIEKFSFTGYRIYSHDHKMIKGLIHSRYNAKEGFVVRRTEFDNALLKKAIEAGCRFLPEHKATSLNQTNEEVEVVTDKKALTGKVAVVADGSGISLTKKILPNAEPGQSVAVMAFFENASYKKNDLVVICDKNMVAAYGWVFMLPGGVANIGAGADLALLKSRNQNIKQYFNEHLKQEPIKGMLGNGKIVSKIRSFPLRMNFNKAVFRHQNVLFAGDATNLVYPLSGEGIPYAMMSGRIAAEVANKALAASNLKILAEYHQRANKVFKNFKGACFYKNHVTQYWLQRILFNTAYKDEYFCEKSIHMLENTSPIKEVLAPKSIWKMVSKGLF
jgi:geranylgeranyl reductase family protein